MPPENLKGRSLLAPHNTGKVLPPTRRPEMPLNNSSTSHWLWCRQVHTCELLPLSDGKHCTAYCPDYSDARERRLTPALTRAGPIMLEMQTERTPGVECSAIVGPHFIALVTLRPR